jgi:hypothetical protein
MEDLLSNKMTAAGAEEGPIAEKIEDQTSNIPSDVFLWVAVAAMAVSAGLKISGRKHTALFVGQWVAPFLLFGIYNKIVKTMGHDKHDNSSAGMQGY